MRLRVKWPLQGERFLQTPLAQSTLIVVLIKQRLISDY